MTLPNTSVTADSLEVDVSAPTDAVQLGNLLLTTDTYAHVLESVLNGLPAKFLRETCFHVCSTWASAVSKVGPLCRYVHLLPLCLALRSLLIALSKTL